MGFTDAVRSVLTCYAEFQGRAARSEFWWYVLFYLLVQLVAAVLDVALFPELAFGVFETIAGLALLLPSIAVTARRLHDTDRSGWWQLIGLLPIVGLLVLIWFCVQRGTEGANRFGEAPMPMPKHG